MKIMKSNELMLGDWVVEKSVDYVNGVIKYVEEKREVTTNMLSQLYNQETGVLGKDNLYSIVVEPIELTSKMLENNGFERNPHKDSHYYLDDEFVEVDIHETTDSIWVLEAKDLEFSMPTQRAMVCGIHELQHALRLCGIKKKIVL